MSTLKKILDCIYDCKENIYCSPGNITALCAEVDFKLKFKNKEQVFQELNNKLKFIFDIKDENDMINKVLFYL